MSVEHEHRKRSWLLSPSGLVLLGSLAIIAFFLIVEHRAHLYGALPYVLIGVFLIFHMFMHGGHGGHGGHGSDAEPPEQREERESR